MAILQFVLLIAFGLFLSGGPSAAQPEPAREPECRHRLEDMPGTWTKQERSAWNERLCIGENKVDFADFSESGACEETVVSSAFIRRLLTYRPMRDVLDRYSTSSIELKCASLNEQLDLREVRSDKGIDFYDFLFREGIDVGGSSLRHVAIINSEVHSDFSGTGVETDGDIYLGNSVLHANLILSRAKISGAMVINDSRIYGRTDLAYSDVHEGVMVYKCSLGGGENTESDEVALDIMKARIFADVQLYGCNIQGMVRGYYVHIDGRLRILNPDINGDLDFSHANVGTVDVYGLILGNEHPDPICKFRGINLSYAKISGDLTLGSDSTTCEIGGYVIGPRIKVASDIKVKNTEWKEMYLAEANVEGSLDLSSDNCSDEQGRRKLTLRNANVRGITDRECVWESIDGDFSGWKYDSEAMKEILERDAEWLGEWLSTMWIASKQDGSSETLEKAERHTPQPYIYLAERLSDLGMTEKANAIRILERERNLLQLKGLEGFWQWIVGQTTRFGYRPARALLWFFGLIVVGTVILTLTDCKYGMKLRGKYPRRFRVVEGMVLMVATATWVVGTFGWGVVEQASWTCVGYGSIILIGLCFCLPAFGARQIKRRNPSTEESRKGRTWSNNLKGAFLYSMDRAVPFLGFDSEHVRWFEETQRLNDMPFVCIYFYLHSILGFALTSLFIAGLTGLLK